MYMSLDTSAEGVQEVHEKLDEQFLAELWKHIDAYYIKNHNPKFPKASLPENQEMTLLLETIRQTNNINARNKNEHTLLSLVAYTNERELLELLLSHPKIDVNTQNKQKNTPLMMVVLKWGNMVPMLEPLLARSDIDLEIRNNYGKDGATALMTAERHWYPDVIELLKAKQTKLAEKPKTLEGVISTTQDAVSALQEVISSSPECSMEDETFRIESASWNVVDIIDASGNKMEAKMNTEGDIWELGNGEQFFTPDSMARELSKAGRVNDVMTAEQASWLQGNPIQVSENSTFGGFINLKDGKVYYSGAQACYWVKDSRWTNTHKALFAMDMNQVDDDLKPYIEEVTIDEYDTKSAMQIRLLKPKTK